MEIQNSDITTTAGVQRTGISADENKVNTTSPRSYKITTTSNSLTDTYVIRTTSMITRIETTANSVTDSRIQTTVGVRTSTTSASTLISTTSPSTVSNSPAHTNRITTTSMTKTETTANSDTNTRAQTIAIVQTSTTSTTGNQTTEISVSTVETTLITTESDQITLIASSCIHKTDTASPTGVGKTSILTDIDRVTTRFTTIITGTEIQTRSSLSVLTTSDIDQASTSLTNIIPTTINSGIRVQTNSTASIETQTTLYYFPNSRFPTTSQFISVVENQTMLPYTTTEKLEETTILSTGSANMLTNWFANITSQCTLTRSIGPSSASSQMTSTSLVKNNVVTSSQEPVSTGNDEISTTSSNNNTPSDQLANYYSTALKSSTLSPTLSGVGRETTEAETLQSLYSISSLLDASTISQANFRSEILTTTTAAYATNIISTIGTPSPIIATFVESASTQSNLTPTPTSRTGSTTTQGDISTSLDWSSATQTYTTSDVKTKILPTTVHLLENITSFQNSEVAESIEMTTMETNEMSSIFESSEKTTVTLTEISNLTNDQNSQTHDSTEITTTTTDKIQSTAVIPQKTTGQFSPVTEISSSKFSVSSSEMKAKTELITVSPQSMTSTIFNVADTTPLAAPSSDPIQISSSDNVIDTTSMSSIKISRTSTETSSPDPLDSSITTMSKTQTIEMTTDKPGISRTTSETTNMLYLSKTESEAMTSKRLKLKSYVITEKGQSPTSTQASYDRTNTKNIQSTDVPKSSKTTRMPTVSIPLSKVTSRIRKTDAPNSHKPLTSRLSNSHLNSNTSLAETKHSSSRKPTYSIDIAATTTKPIGTTDEILDTLTSLRNNPSSTTPIVNTDKRMVTTTMSTDETSKSPSDILIVNTTTSVHGASELETISRTTKLFIVSSTSSSRSSSTTSEIKSSFSIIINDATWKSMSTGLSDYQTTHLDFQTIPKFSTRMETFKGSSPTFLDEPSVSSTGGKAASDMLLNMDKFNKKSTERTVKDSPELSNITFSTRETKATLTMKINIYTGSTTLVPSLLLLYFTSFHSWKILLKD